MNPLFELLGLDVPPGNEADVLKKIYKDSYVQMKAYEAMVEHFASAGIQKMLPLEQRALGTRVSPPPVDNSVRWVVSIGMKSQRPILIGKYKSEECYFDGDPERAPTVEFHGAHPSPEILARYAALYDPNNAARMDVAYWHARTSKK